MIMTLRLQLSNKSNCFLYKW